MRLPSSTAESTTPSNSVISVPKCFQLGSTVLFAHSPAVSHGLPPVANLDRLSAKLLVTITLKSILIEWMTVIKITVKICNWIIRMRYIVNSLNTFQIFEYQNCLNTNFVLLGIKCWIKRTIAVNFWFFFNLKKIALFWKFVYFRRSIRVKTNVQDGNPVVSGLGTQLYSLHTEGKPW